MKLLTYLSLTVAGSLLVALFSLDPTDVSVRLQSKIAQSLGPTVALAESPNSDTIATENLSVAGHIFHLQQTTPAGCEQAHMLLDQEKLMLPPTEVFNSEKNKQISEWIGALCNDDNF
tara:strand:+ start:93994 stop:94347 length:354 start_codon:yes stop_codon:yes gene_type:complete